MLVPTGWLVGVGLGPEANKLEVGFQMVQASTSVHVVEIAHKNECCPRLCPKSEFHLPPTSPADSRKSASESDSGSFQITASFLSP